MLLVQTPVLEIICSKGRNIHASLGVLGKIAAKFGPGTINSKALRGSQPE